MEINWFIGEKYFCTVESVKINWFIGEKYFCIIESVKINWFNGEKYFFSNDSVKKQITNSVSENLTDSYLKINLEKFLNFQFS